MKKIIIAATILFILILAGCNKKLTEDVPTTNLLVATTTTSKTTTTISWPTVDSVTPYSNYYNNWEPEGWHRNIYYEVGRYMIDLVDIVDYEKWYLSGIKLNDFNEMAIVQFIKRFNITREQFDEANERIMRESSLEPYNAELIYTFDTYAISDYYRQYDDEGNEINWRELEPWNELLKE